MALNLIQCLSLKVVIQLILLHLKSAANLSAFSSKVGPFIEAPCSDFAPNHLNKAANLFIFPTFDSFSQKILTPRLKRVPNFFSEFFYPCPESIEWYTILWSNICPPPPPPHTHTHTHTFHFNQRLIFFKKRFANNFPFGCHSALYHINE